MGNQESSDYDPDDGRFDGIDTLGYRVLGVQPNSPASSAGLVSFFDFLVGCDGRMLLGRSVDDEGNEIGEDEEEYDDVDFPALLRESVGKELELLVWNIKSQTQRFVKIVPRSDWGGTGLLGVTIRLDDYADADERLIRVLSIEHNSPAAIAGLEPLTDYLLGTTTVSFNDDSTLAQVLHQHVDKVVELYVYNTESDVVRVVTLMPTLSWGGRGLLGAEVGTGYLHRLPHHCRGTGGSSVERKVRTGARPPSSEFRQSGEGTGAASGAGAAAAAAAGANGGNEVLSEEEAGLIDLTASGSQDAAIHHEPQLEFEPDPDNPGSHHRAAVTVARLQAETAAPAPPEPAPAPEPESEQKSVEETLKQSEKEEVVPQETQEPAEKDREAEEGAATAAEEEAGAANPEPAEQQSTASASSEQQPDPSAAAAPSVPPPPPAVAAESAASTAPPPPPPPAALPKETAIPPPPPPPPAAAAAAFSAPPPPPPPPQMPAPPAAPAMTQFAMPPPPNFGEKISYGGGPIPPPPPPMPAAYGGLPPPPVANVADSPEKGGQGEVDLR